MDIGQEIQNHIRHLLAHFTGQEKKKICLTFTIECATRAISYFERYSNDTRPLQAIEAAINWFEDPSRENRRRARDASIGASTAANTAVLDVEDAAAADAADAAMTTAYAAGIASSYDSIASTILAVACAIAADRLHLDWLGILTRIITEYEYSRILPLTGQVESINSTRSFLLPHAGPEIMSRIHSFLYPN